MSVKVAINGFGRIGRAFFKLASRNSQIQIVAINDLADKETLQYLLEHDSVYGFFKADFSNIELLQEKNPENLPWGKLNVDIVVESTGRFTTKELAEKHIKAGAKKVVISAPSDDAHTVLVGVNSSQDTTVTSNASCTTNAASPVLKIIEDAFGIEEAMLTTIHSYTASQSLVDSANKKDLRRGRAAALNIIPTSTGAAKATAKAHEYLKGKFEGVAVRVPTPSGSLADLTILLKRFSNKEEVNQVLKDAANLERWKKVFAVTEESVVSTDIIGRPKAAIADLQMTRVTGRLAKIMVWYDNEIGYASSLLLHVLSVAGK